MEIPKTSFERVVRDAMLKFAPGFKIKQAALEALQEAAEAHVVDLLAHAKLCAKHAGRDTVMQDDVKLAHRLC